jgi:hypothetical protein
MENVLERNPMKTVVSTVERKSDKKSSSETPKRKKNLG